MFALFLPCISGTLSFAKLLIHTLSFFYTYFSPSHQANHFFESVLRNALIPKRPASEERLRALKRQQIIDGLWYTGIAVVTASIAYLGFWYLRGRNESASASAPTSPERSVNAQSSQLVRRASRAIQEGLS